jgi:hypothetical protein
MEENRNLEVCELVNLHSSLDKQVCLSHFTEGLFKKELATLAMAGTCSYCHEQTQVVRLDAMVTTLVNYFIEHLSPQKSKELLSFIQQEPHVATMPSEFALAIDAKLLPGYDTIYDDIVRVFDEQRFFN